MRVRALFSLGGIEWRWWACLCAGALKEFVGLEVGYFAEDEDAKLLAAVDRLETACAILDGGGAGGGTG